MCIRDSGLSGGATAPRTPPDWRLRRAGGDSRGGLGGGSRPGEAACAGDASRGVGGAAATPERLQ
eukprot:10480360-Alexandrium_andersonii.AAC.1